MSDSYAKSDDMCGVPNTITLTADEREAIEYFAAFHRSPREGDALAAATLGTLLERMT